MGVQNKKLKTIIMYYKIKKGDETYDRLDLIFNEMRRCNEAAISLVESLGHSKYGRGRFTIAGGISCIQMGEKQEGFKKVGKGYEGLYYPRANNKELLVKFESLPLVEYETFNKVIGFEKQQVGATYYRSFGCQKAGGLYLIDVDDSCEYSPKNDMVEILGSEFKMLTAKK